MYLLVQYQKSKKKENGLTKPRNKKNEKSEK